MKIIYKVNEKEFEDEKEAEAYEKKIEEERIKKEKLKAEQDSRAKEIQEAYDCYVNLVKQYCKDYNKRGGWYITYVI